VAIPLIVVAMVLPPVGLAALSGEVSTYHSITLFIAIFTVFGFLVGQFSYFTAWPRACLLLGLCALLIPAIGDKTITLPGVAAGLGLAGVNYGLGRLTVLVLTRPIGVDIADSPIDIPYPLAGVAGRVRLQMDQLRLELRRTYVLTLPLKELRGVTYEELLEPVTWALNSTVELDLPAGPAVRLTSSDREWLLPVHEHDGEAMSIAIAIRALQNGNEQIR
jgi:hypothetical protein